MQACLVMMIIKQNKTKLGNNPSLHGVNKTAAFFQSLPYLNNLNQVQEKLICNIMIFSMCSFMLHLHCFLPKPHGFLGFLFFKNSFLLISLEISHKTENNLCACACVREGECVRSLWKHKDAGIYIPLLSAGVSICYSKQIIFSHHCHM